ncbi:MAG: RNA polymerase subunit sigma [Planctomycetaceae bacterium]|nr:RNA polymerase subunit sigma [Planctomycetaceae bacterium]
MKQCLTGDQLACRAFVERFQGAVFGLCLRMLRHRQDAEDVAQEVFVRVFRNLHRWDSNRPINPWLLTITANRCRTYIEQRSRKPTQSEIVEDTEAKADRSMSQDFVEELQLALDALREEYRNCFVLFYQNELSCAEVSEVLGCPEGTVKTWLHRARREVADFLKNRGVTTDEQVAVS